MQINILEHLRTANIHRCPAAFGHDIDDWAPEQWTNALAGEVGELCNLIKKKYSRHEDIPRDDIEDEIGDVLTYLDILCTRLHGKNLEECLVTKFNKVSEKKSVKIKLPTPEDTVWVICAIPGGYTYSPKYRRHLAAGEIHFETENDAIKEVNRIRQSKPTIDPEVLRKQGSKIEELTAELRYSREVVENHFKHIQELEKEIEKLNEVSVDKNSTIKGLQSFLLDANNERDRLKKMNDELKEELWVLDQKTMWTVVKKGGNWISELTLTRDLPAKGNGFHLKQDAQKYADYLNSCDKVEQFTEKLQQNINAYACAVRSSDIWNPESISAILKEGHKSGKTLSEGTRAIVREEILDLLRELGGADEDHPTFPGKNTWSKPFELVFHMRLIADRLRKEGKIRP